MAYVGGGGDEIRVGIPLRHGYCLEMSTTLIFRGGSPGPEVWGSRKNTRSFVEQKYIFLNKMALANIIIFDSIL